MVANACMHCADPVCLIGCPTGAIHRSSAGGEVVINPITCIGCKACFNNCPYDAIRMVEIRDRKGEMILGADTKPVVKATKCDLCVEQIGGPACQRACPHGALARMNMEDLGEFTRWLTR
jgi:Fe-S-cluster-containing dehydrogenase component